MGSQASPRRSIKCLAVGDRDSGKSALLHACSRVAAVNALPWTGSVDSGDYSTPDIFNDCTVTVEDAQLSLSDTTGSEEYDRLRQLSYPQTDVFLVCFSLVSPTGWRRVRDVWYPELRLRCPAAAVVLVGTKLEQRDRLLMTSSACLARIPASMTSSLTMASSTSSSYSSLSSSLLTTAVTSRQGAALAEAIGAVKYIECSALTCQGVGDVLAEAAAALKPKQAKPFWSWSGATAVRRRLSACRIIGKRAASAATMTTLARTRSAAA